jgi:hypothetical protein
LNSAETCAGPKNELGCKHERSSIEEKEAEERAPRRQPARRRHRRGRDGAIRPIKATHAGVIRIGDLELACANLPDGRRVVSETTMMAALGRGYSGYYSKRDAAAEPGSAVMPRYLAPAVLKPFITGELTDLQLIPYLTPPSGTLAKGVSAEAVPRATWSGRTSPCG